MQINITSSDALQFFSFCDSFLENQEMLYKLGIPKNSTNVSHRNIKIKKVLTALSLSSIALMGLIIIAKLQCMLRNE